MSFMVKVFYKAAGLGFCLFVCNGKFHVKGDLPPLLSVKPGVRGEKKILKMTSAISLCFQGPRIYTKTEKPIISRGD